MTAIRTVAVSVLLLTTFGCQEEASVIKAPIEGHWQGTLAEIQVKPFGLPLPFNDDDPSFASIVEFHSDGTMIFWDDDIAREGTYTMTGDNLNIETDYTVEDISLSGTYSIQTLTETSLVIYLKKEDQVVDVEGAPAVKGDIKITLHFARS